MTSYAFWNNKGGVGKSFLCFIAAAEYAHRNPDTDVYVIDTLPTSERVRDVAGRYINAVQISWTSFMVQSLVRPLQAT